MGRWSPPLVRICRSKTRYDFTAHWKNGIVNIELWRETNALFISSKPLYPELYKFLEIRKILAEILSREAFDNSQRTTISTFLEKKFSKILYPIDDTYVKI